MQILLNGLMQGVLFGTVGVAFALVYRTTKVFHVALGGICAIVPYVVLTAIAYGLPAWVSALLAIVSAAALGILIEECIHWPFSRKRAPTEIHLIGSLGAYLVFVQCIALIWGSETRVLRAGADRTWEMLGISFARMQLVGSLSALLGSLALLVWLSRAGRGLQLRALADNPVLVALLGRDVRMLRRWVFGLSGGLAAIMALAQAWDVGFDPHLGLNIVLTGMVAMIIGGGGSLAGPLIGGVLLGIVQACVIWFGEARWEEAVTFALLALFLFVRPQGIFSRRLRLEEGT